MSDFGPYRRVVVGITSSATRVGGLTTAADIAHLFGAELAGLYIEDEALLNVTDLPFAVEIASAGTARPLRRAEVEKAYRSAAGTARRQLEGVASKAKITCSFNMLRGNIEISVEQSATTGDIVTFVEPESALERACLSTASLFAAAMRSRGALLYLPVAQAQWRGGVVAFLGGAADRAVIEAAARIAMARSVPLTLIGRGPDAEWHQLFDEVLRKLGGAIPAVTYRTLNGDSIETLLARFADLDDHLLVVAREAGSLTAPQELRALIRHRRAPLLLVEPENDSPG